MTDFTDDMRRRLERLVGNEDDFARIEVLAGDVRALLRDWQDRAETENDLAALTDKHEDLKGELRDANETIANLHQRLDTHDEEAA